MSLGGGVGGVGGQTRHELEHRLVKDGQRHTERERGKEREKVNEDITGHARADTH